MNESSSTILSSGDAIEDLERWARMSSEELLPLPNSVYTSPDLLKEEIDKLFYREWICAGHVSELHSPGDYLTFDIVDKPVLIVCDEAGKIRAFSNVCRHRGTVLASGSGKRRVFTCPYHAWSYDLSGSLRNAPYMDQEKVQGIALPEYCVEIWQGLVFINLDPEAEPLAPRLEKLEERISVYDFTKYKALYRSDAEIACNWKVLIENWGESYHHFQVHKTSLEPTLPTETSRVWEGASAFNHHSLVFTNTGDVDKVQTAKLPPELRDLSHNICIYPGLLLGSDPGGAFMWISVRPTGPQTLKYTIGILILAVENDEITKELLEMHRNYFDIFMNEDKAIIELLQRGLAANTGTAGVLHPWEQTNWQFGHYLAREITAAPSQDLAAVNFS